MRTYFKFLHLHKLTGSTLSTYLEYIERNLPEGVSLKTTKIELLQLDEYLRQPPPKEEWIEWNWWLRHLRLDISMLYGMYI